MSYYENRIKHLEGLVATMAREQRMKAIPVEAKLVERIAEYQAENARLKAEVERLRASSFVTAVPVEEYEKLKAELTNCKAEADYLKAEVERLRKAGDAMAEQLIYEGYSNDEEPCKAWNAAKEGKQP